MTTLFKFWKKIFNLPLVLTVFSFSTFILFSSFEKAKVNTPAYKLTAEEKAWMEPFFRGVMLQNQAIYTLWGSKPMTMISIEDEDLSDNGQLSKKDKKNRIAFEDYHLLKNWEKWEKVKSQFPHNRYSFFKRTDSTDSKQDTIYFVDLTKV